jgi:hypothetical protein
VVSSDDWHWLSGSSTLWAPARPGAIEPTFLAAKAHVTVTGTKGRLAIRLEVSIAASL